MYHILCWSQSLVIQLTHAIIVTLSDSDFYCTLSLSSALNGKTDKKMFLKFKSLKNFKCS